MTTTPLVAQPMAINLGELFPFDRSVSVFLRFVHCCVVELVVRKRRKFASDPSSSCLWFSCKVKDSRNLAEPRPWNSFFFCFGVVGCVGVGLLCELRSRAPTNSFFFSSRASLRPWWFTLLRTNPFVRTPSKEPHSNRQRQTQKRGTALRTGREEAKHVQRSAPTCSTRAKKIGKPCIAIGDRTRDLRRVKASS